MLLFTQAPNGALSSLLPFPKTTPNPNYRLFHRSRFKFPAPNPRRRPLTSLIIATAANGEAGPATRPAPPPPFSAKEPKSDTVFVGDYGVPLEGVIQFEKPDAAPSKFVSWAVVLWVGWFLGAYFLGAYVDDGKGLNGTTKAITTAAKSSVVGIPLGILIRAATSGHIPPIAFMLVTKGSTGILLTGWRTLVSKSIPSKQSKKNDVYKRGVHLNCLSYSHLWYGGGDWGPSINILFFF